MVVLEIAVRIPFFGGIGLHQADAAFHQTSGQEQFRSVIFRFFVIDPVKLPRFFGFAFQVDNLVGFELHTKGQFEAVDAGLKIGFKGVRIEMTLVHLADEVQLRTLLFNRHPLGPVKVQNRLVAGIKHRALVFTG